MSNLQKVSEWMMGHGYATGHGTSVGDLLQELEWQVAEREREACAKVCDEIAQAKTYQTGYLQETAEECVEAIRSRGIDGAKVGEVGVWGEEKNA